MAKGTLGTATYLNDTATHVVYTVPASTVAVVTLNVCNRDSASVAVSIGIERAGSTGTLSNGEYLEYETSVIAHSVMERSGILLASGDSVVVKANIANMIDVNIWGIEE
ncbi:MAG TPA: hypothetical protein EYP92_04145 [Candidatus Thioglobus sp.]|jgi:hypothetical protein|nr:hypothetical protein [Candidatus Thioglobus sp.]